MDKSSKETTGDRSTQIALTMGLLLFASVVLGSGAVPRRHDRFTNKASGFEFVEILIASI